MTREQIIEMFTLRLDGETFQSIADKYSISRQCAYQILSNVVSPKYMGVKYAKSCVFPYIKTAMAQNNITYKELDAAFALSKGYSRRVLTGKQKLTVCYALKLSNYFHLPLETIIQTE